MPHRAFSAYKKVISMRVISVYDTTTAVELLSILAYQFDSILVTSDKQERATGVLQSLVDAYGLDELTGDIAWRHCVMGNATITAKASGSRGEAVRDGKYSCVLVVDADHLDPKVLRSIINTGIAIRHQYYKESKDATTSNG